jgi:AraC family transcriptional regulator
METAMSDEWTPIPSAEGSGGSTEATAPSCITWFELLEPAGAALTPVRYWTAPGFAVELNQPPPFAGKGRQRFTSLMIPFGQIVGNIAINSDQSQPVQYQAGDIELFPEDTLTTELFTHVDPFVTVRITPERVAELTHTLFGDQPGQLRPRLQIRTPTTQPLYRLLRAYLQTQLEWRPLYLDSLLTVLAVEVLQQAWSGASPPPPAKLSLAPVVRRRVLDYIETHFMTDLSLSDLAAVACLSPYHFARCFRQEFGKPPHRYVLDRRLEFARRLLANTNLPLAEVTARCGFSSQSHLSTVFQKSFGITPRQYRTDCS